MKYTIEFTPTTEKTFCFKAGKQTFTTTFHGFNKEFCIYVHAHLMSGNELIASTDKNLGVGTLYTEFLQDYVDMLMVGANIEVFKKEGGAFDVRQAKTYSREDMIHAMTYGHGRGRQGMSHEQTLLDYREEHL